MTKTFLTAALMIWAALITSGCVDRKITINTDPADAVVILNDEEIGTSPVSVGFEWYGDYNVEIRKAGFETLKTHRQLPRPWYDRFPADFFAQILWPKRISDHYTWEFKLTPYIQPSKEELIRSAVQMKQQTNIELAEPTKQK